MAEKIHAGKKRSRSDAINYLCTHKCQCLPNYSTLLKDIKSTQTRFHKPSCQRNSTTLPTNNNLASRVEEINKAATTNGSSHGLVEFQVEGLKHVPKSVSFDPRNQEITPPDQYSQTVVGAIKGKRKADDNMYNDEPLSSESSSSLYSLHTTNSTSDKRRDKINKKMRMLKDLIPNCNKMDKASMLDDAIEYLKALKCQLQIMSMGLHMPLMMLPTATPHMTMMMYTPHLHHLMGFRSPLPVINDNNGVRMFGFPNQMPPMPISPVSMVANPSIQNIRENQAS